MRKTGFFGDCDRIGRRCDDVRRSVDGLSERRRIHFQRRAIPQRKILAEHGRPQSVSLDELQSVLERADFSKEALRVGFLTAAVSVEISISCGEAALIVRPLSFGDNWMWYAENFIGRDFDELLTEYYFSVKSAGMIPPIYQLMIFAGADRNDIPFNLVLFAQPDTPVEKIEAAYTLDEAQMKAYWIAMLESPDAETEMGVFEQTIVFIPTVRGNR